MRMRHRSQMMHEARVPGVCDACAGSAAAISRHVGAVMVRLCRSLGYI